jgi:hypothetical protein
MELKDFIKTTLVEITNGVVEAQLELKDTGCLINPEGFSMQGGQIKQGYKNEYRAIQMVKMNIAVSVTENSGKKSGIGVAKIINAGINSEQMASNEKITTIEFEVPIALPVMEVTK